MNKSELTALQRVTLWFQRPANVAKIFTAFALTSTLALAIFSSKLKPISWALSLSLALVAGFFQLAASSKLREEGRANPTLARSTVNRLLNLIRKIDSISLQVDETLISSGIEKTEQQLRETRIHLGYISDSLKEQFYDWQQFHKEALEELLAEYEKYSKKQIEGTKND